MDDLTDGVGFLYKTMLERDPGKRRVKPVQHHLLQLDFGGLDDSSDDSDYEVKETKDSDGSEDLGSSEDDESSEGSDSESSQDVKDTVDVELPQDDDTISLADSNSLFVGDFAEAVQASGSVVLSENGTSSVSSSHKMTKILICCVCLRDYGEEEDEIVECDGCGAAVHEGCYGIGDCDSAASSVSSASTEPWFCDACKAGVKPHCELCPNSGGIYKETDNFRWVHIVCALYIPGVAFGDVDKLSPVTLFEMSYTKWGAKECSLCEDDNFSCTGVMICCDAGMCRTYFHVTCAQKEGLLSEASPDEEIADPFFAYCKQHADKNMARAKRRNHLAIRSNMKLNKDWGGLDDRERLRVQRKLTRHRKKYHIAKSKRPPCWQPTEKMPRMLFSSPSATRRLMRKAELLGIHTQSQTINHKDIRRKWHIPPALSTEFASYYFDRNDRITTMKKHSSDLINQREKLQQLVAILRVKYDRLLEEQEESKVEVMALLKQVEDMYGHISDLGGKLVKMPAALQPSKPMKQVTKKEMIMSPPSVGLIHECGICQKTNNQHLLTRCDACRFYYHLGCLQPPLTRMPKKTKLMGWQCSECATSCSDGSDDPEVDPEAPRQLREKIKEPLKFTPTLHCIKERRRSEVTKNILRKGRTKKKLSLPAKLQPLSPKAPLVPAVKLTKSPKSLKLATPVTTGKRATKNDQESHKIPECSVCLTSKDVTNIVVCDYCQLGYHPQCLVPPQSKSPRYRGYAWFCTACQQNSDENISPSTTSSSGGQRSKRPSPLRRHNTAANDPDIIIMKVDTPDYAESQPTSQTKTVPPIKLFTSVKKRSVARASAVRVKGQYNRTIMAGKSDKKSTARVGMVIKETVESPNKIPTSNLSETRPMLPKCSVEYSDEVIVLDDDDDDYATSKVNFTCPGGNFSDTKVKESESMDVTSVSPAKVIAPESPVKGSPSPRCGLPTSTKRPMILSRNAKSKETSEISESKKLKIDFAEIKNQHQE